MIDEHTRIAPPPSTTLGSLIPDPCSSPHPPIYPPGVPKTGFRQAKLFGISEGSSQNAQNRVTNLHFSQALILGVFVLVLETRLAFSMGVLAGGTLLRPRYGLVP
ncbi:MAG: hypothetical protein ACLQKY_04650, partial [Terracidiphilus sp.]